jgi:hypothetical protein
MDFLYKKSNDKTRSKKLKQKTKKIKKRKMLCKSKRTRRTHSGATSPSLGNCNVLKKVL